MLRLAVGPKFHYPELHATLGTNLELYSQLNLTLLKLHDRVPLLSGRLVSFKELLSQVGKKGGKLEFGKSSHTSLQIGNRT